MPDQTPRRPTGRVAVLGGGPAGMAAAARLAKAGHTVVLAEAGDRLGGPWADNAAPSVLTFPAPWRDLFRKSGRTLAEESRRAGLELVAAPAVEHRFPDGSVLELPSGRAEQYEAIGRFAGVRAAEGWRELLNVLAGMWQLQRHLGLEAELADAAALDRATRAALWSDRSVADLAAGLPDPRLAALVGETGTLLGSTPADTPAHCATTLLVEQTFGRWQLVGHDEPGSAVPLSELVALLAARLDLRRVDVRLKTQVDSLEADRRGVKMLTLSTHQDGAQAERIAVDAVVVAVHPRPLYTEWLDAGRLSLALRRERRAFAGTRPALAPAVEPLTTLDPSPRTAGETHHHHAGSAAVVECWSSRPARYDYRRTRPDEAAGLRWLGFDSWLRRVPTRSALPGLFFAGCWTRSGQGPDREILSAALAATAAGEFLRG